MLKGTLRTVRYARGWNAGADVKMEETLIRRDGEEVPATLVLPAQGRGPWPAWIALGGISRMGRHHPQLVRFAGALATSGAAVVVPEIPEWRRLELAPQPTAPTIRGCVDMLRERPDVGPGKVGLIGFSFGAPQLAIAAAREDLEPHIAGIALFGGYCSLERTLECMFTGDHEWEGARHEVVPDPYGRWVVGANHLTDVPGLEDAGDVAEALFALACAASGDRVAAWEPYHDTLIRDLRSALPERRKAIFDLFATASTEERPAREARLDMAHRLAEACRRVEPLLEPTPYLSDVRVPTRLIHGRGDRLIPFTECFRLSEGLPEAARSGRTVTGLFSHTADRREGSSLGQAWEKVTFLGTLHGLLSTVA
jgi:pimeloyl-ACP methyl ester carboxylesterase